MRCEPLFKIPEELLPEVGGKARGLYLLNQAGLPVSDGFILYDVQTEEDLQKALEYYEHSDLFTVAVRSSAKGEDGVDFSGAGQYATVLNVTKDTFVEAVKTCLDSVHSETAKSYGDAFLATPENKMTVVVQSMVAAEKSGVCFTKDPTAREGGMLIEAVHGFGESLVSGMATADQYRLSEDGHWDAPCNETSVLTEEQRQAVAIGASKARAALEMELDLEWAINKAGKLIWLQARPITTEETATVHELDTKRNLDNHVITTCNIGEMLPGVVTPLSLSTSVYGIDWGIRKMLVEVGVYPSMERIPEWSCVVSVGNTLFLDLTTLYSMSKRIMAADKSSMELSICGRILEDAPDTDFPEASLPTKLSNGKKYGKFLLSVKKQKAVLDTMVETLRILPVDDPMEYYRRIDEQLYVMNEALFCHYASSSFSGAMNSALYMTLDKEYEDKSELKAKIAGVLENIDDIESVDILRSLRKIASAILSRNPDAVGWSAEQIADYIYQDGGEAQYEYDNFLFRHGHRSIREAELRSKAWKDDEQSLMEYIRIVIASGAKETECDREQWKKNRDALLEGKKTSAKKTLSFLIDQARKGVRDREYTKSGIIKVIDVFKLAYRDLAALLVERNLLVDEDCIFFLTHEEIGKLIREQDLSLNKKALARRRVMIEQKQFVYPEISIGRPQAITVESVSKGNVFQGVPVSRGTAVGKARVVRSVEDAEQLQKGEIMISGFTDIGWSPYYCMINGLVTEVGSALSHGAVVAREYALPLVVNLPKITSIIHTGDYVSVNGTTGEVQILDEAEAKTRMAQM